MSEPALTVSLCGEVTAAIDGIPVDIGPTKCKLVLAALALTPGTPVPQSRLVDLVWSTDPPATAERTLQSYVARLRKTLGSDSIARNANAYCLVIASEAVDTARFEQLLDDGHVADALAVWTGIPLSGLEAPGFTPAVTALTERWLNAVEADIEARLDAEPASVIAGLTELTAHHPFREALWALLMTALYRTGRQADALAAYQSAHNHLVEQLGIEPGPQLKELEQMILEHDARLSHAEHPGPEDQRQLAGQASTRSDEAGAHRETARHAAVPLIGRDETVATILTAIENYRTVTLVGPGGIGKTSLALTVAASLAPTSDVWIVELADIAPGGDVARAVADAIEIPGDVIRPTSDAIAQALEGHANLLVLDNCEHVLDAAASLAETIGRRSPTTRVLATSRERLGMPNERVVVVEPLDASTSGIELFNERATALSHWFDPDASHDDVEAICQRVGAIPLAIELAAARTTSLTTAELRQRLDAHHGLSLLGSPRNTGERHETMRATIRWSYDLLNPAEQTALQRLAVFTSTFDLTAAEDVATDDATDPIEVDHLVGSLVDQSMLAIELTPSGRRFRLLEPIRDFAIDRLNRLNRNGNTNHAEQRHTKWCLRKVNEIGTELAGWDEIAGVSRLDELWPELRATVQRALADGDRDLVRSLVRPILGEIVLRSRHEIGDWLEQLLDITPADDTDTRVFAHYWAAHRYSLSQTPDGYRRLVERHAEPDHPLLEHGRSFATGDHTTQARTAPIAGAILRQQGDHHLAERTDINIAASLLNLARYDEQEALTIDLIERYRTQGPPTYLNWSLMLLGYNALFQGRPDQADAHFDAAIEVDIPARTHSPNSPIEARRAHRNGRHHDAYQILSAHIADILATDNDQAGLLAFIEFVNMMVATGRNDDAATILQHLETTGLLDNPAWRSLVADAQEKLGAPHTNAPRPDLSAREALQQMGAVLDEVTTPTN